MRRNLQHVWSDDVSLDHNISHYSALCEGRACLRARRRLARKLASNRWFRGGGDAVKRAMDLFGASAGIVFLSPLLALTWLAIRVEDRAPAIFVQERVGQGGRLFRMFKFRSMVPDAERRLAELKTLNESAGGVLFKLRNDPRVTRVGRIIRKLSIDELPQLFNVLAGDMSLVGPRPALPREVAQYTVAQRVRLEAKPGITCLWQIGGRSEIGIEGQAQLDLEYLRERSAALDAKIMLKTVPVVIGAKGAY